MDAVHFSSLSWYQPFQYAILKLVNFMHSVQNAEDAQCSVRDASMWFCTWYPAKPSIVTNSWFQVWCQFIRIKAWRRLGSKFMLQDFINGDCAVCKSDVFFWADWQTADLTTWTLESFEASQDAFCIHSVQRVTQHFECAKSRVCVRKVRQVDTLLRLWFLDINIDPVSSTKPSILAFVIFLAFIAGSRC